MAANIWSESGIHKGWAPGRERLLQRRGRLLRGKCCLLCQGALGSKRKLKARAALQLFPLEASRVFFVNVWQVSFFRELPAILTGKHPDVFRVRIFPEVSSHLFCDSKSPGPAVPGALIPDDSSAKDRFCRACWACGSLLKSLTFLPCLHWDGVQAGLGLAGSDPEASRPLTSKHCSICSVSSSKRNAVCVLGGHSIMWTKVQLSGHQ